jgi:hypothetical protein
VCKGVFLKLSLQDSGGKADLARQDGEAVRRVLLRLTYVFSTAVAGRGSFFTRLKPGTKMKRFFSGSASFFSSLIFKNSVRVK